MSTKPTLATLNPLSPPGLVSVEEPLVDKCVRKLYFTTSRFFSVSNNGILPYLKTRATEMSAPNKNSIREEYCPFHLEVEWEISYETFQKRGDSLRSPVFKIGRDSYMLELDSDFFYVVFRGPSSDSDRSFTVQYWGGLKRNDGDYDLTYESHSEEFYGSYDKGDIGFIPDTDLDRLYLTQDGSLKFFFRINIKRPLVGVETCIHGTPRMPHPEAGSIRQEACSLHQHVEWNINYVIQKDNATNLTSPVFKIGTQMYFFQLLRDIESLFVSFHLFRLGRSVDGPAANVRCWIELKCRDGAYPPSFMSDKLNLSEDFGFWTLVQTRACKISTLEEKYLTVDRHLTFFFRMNVDSTGAYLCSHGTIDQVVPQAAGTIREEQCSSHKQVEWEVSCTVSDDRVIDLESPVFQIGTQEYYFTTSFANDEGVDLHLMRRGRSVRGPAATPRCWAGFKGNNGTYRYSLVSQQVDLGEDFGLWTHVDYLMYVGPRHVKELYLTPDSRLTFLFRMNTETTGPQMCTHVSTEMPSSVTGKIREARCSAHTEVEWDVDLDVVRDDKLRLSECLEFSSHSAVHRKGSLTSPVFKINYQMYFMELFGSISDVPFLSLHLYRLGYSVEGPASSVRCWAGLKNPDNTYPPRISSKKLDLNDDFELWTLLAVLRDFHPHAEFIENDLNNIHTLTFFFRMNVEPTGTEECTHGTVDRHAPSGEGSIQIQDCSFHKHVIWDVAYVRSPTRGLQTWRAYCASPVFKIGNQWYQLNVCYDSKEPEVTLELYRSGSPVQDPDSSVQCWAGLKRCDGSYHHHTQKAEVDLGEEFLLLTNVSSFTFPDRSDFERTHVTPDGRLTFFLQLNVPHETGDEATCAHGAVEMCPPGEGCIREKSNNLVEWDVVYEEPREYTHFSTSPVFKMGVQCYLLELCHGIDGILALSLYRFGRSVEGSAGSVRCWAGLKRDRGMHHHNTEGFQFDLRENCELWTKVKTLGYFRLYDLEKEGLTRDGRLTFFFLISAEARESKDVAVQTNGNPSGGSEDKTHQDSEGFEKLRQDDRLWLQHPEKGGPHPSSSHGGIRG